jgi:hypothetical protein
MRTIVGGSNDPTPCYSRRGMRLASKEAATIISPLAMKTEDRLNSDNSIAQTAGGPSWATSRKLTNTVVISERS